MKHPDILKQLTLEQKVALLSGKDVWSTYAFPQAGVPSMVMSDGPHGLRRQLGRGDHLASGPASRPPASPPPPAWRGAGTRRCWRRWAAPWAQRPLLRGYTCSWGRG